jgi:exopolyphosphatase/guanosine-5'-triphosphate,3'-diphosphate pyrophosphatase
VSKSGKIRRERRIVHAASAVIDIGSNTVRLVIYEGSPRAPRVVWNEKVAARLGRDLSITGLIPDEASDEAICALARFALLIEDLDIEDVQTVATAAARDASNGAEFLAKVADLGLEPRLLSGEDEAETAAMGAIGAFPGAHGVVADLGGGSLELVSIAEGTSHQATSLPLGTLRLPALRAGSNKKFDKAVRSEIAGAGWAAAHPGPLYMVGGTWRAFAAYAMRRRDFALTDPHGYRLDIATADELAAEAMSASPEELAEMSGISAMRAGYLPDAAAMLRPLLEELQPDELIFSSWGLREGLLFARLDELQRTKDPLLAGVADFAEMHGASITHAAMLAAWSVELADGRSRSGGRSGARSGERNQGNERLRLASAQLAAALHRVEPNLRYNHALEWALDKRWIGCDPRDRAMICGALIGSMGRSAIPDRLRSLADDDELREAVTWGLGFKLARRLGAASRVSMLSSALIRKKRRLILRLDPSRAPLGNYPVTKDLEVLANFLELEPKVKIGTIEPED